MSEREKHTELERLSGAVPFGLLLRHNELITGAPIRWNAGESRQMQKASVMMMDIPKSTTLSFTEDWPLAGQFYDEYKQRVARLSYGLAVSGDSSRFGYQDGAEIFKSAGDEILFASDMPVKQQILLALHMQKMFEDLMDDHRYERIKARYKDLNSLLHFSIMHARDQRMDDLVLQVGDIEDGRKELMASGRLLDAKELKPRGRGITTTMEFADIEGQTSTPLMSVALPVDSAGNFANHLVEQLMDAGLVITRVPDDDDRLQLIGRTDLAYFDIAFNEGETAQSVLEAFAENESDDGYLEELEHAQQTRIHPDIREYKDIIQTGRELLPPYFKTGREMQVVPDRGDVIFMDIQGAPALTVNIEDDFGVGSELLSVANAYIVGRIAQEMGIQTDANPDGPLDFLNSHADGPNHLKLIFLKNIYHQSGDETVTRDDVQRLESVMKILDDDAFYLQMEEYLIGFFQQLVEADPYYSRRFSQEAVPRLVRNFLMPVKAEKLGLHASIATTKGQDLTVGLEERSVSTRRREAGEHIGIYGSIINTTARFLGRIKGGSRNRLIVHDKLLEEMNLTPHSEGEYQEVSGAAGTPIKYGIIDY